SRRARVAPARISGRGERHARKLARSRGNAARARAARRSALRGGRPSVARFNGGPGGASRNGLVDERSGASAVDGIALRAGRSAARGHRASRFALRQARIDRARSGRPARLSYRVAAWTERARADAGTPARARTQARYAGARPG